MMRFPFSIVRWPLALTMILTAGAVAHGQTAATPPAGAGKASGKEYALTHGSSFDAPPSSARNPFWPIGWTPSAPVAVATVGAVQQLDVRPEQFVVTTISVDYPPLAIINGKSYAVGDQIPVTPDKRVFVTVKQILDGVVVLDYQGHEMRATTAAAGLSRRAK